MATADGRSGGSAERVYSPLVGVLWTELARTQWSDRRKLVQLVIITLAAVVPDFDSAIGIPTLFQLATQYHTTPGEINNLTSKSVNVLVLHCVIAADDDGPQQLEHFPARCVVALYSVAFYTRLNRLGRLGWGSLFAVMLMRRFGRLPVLFWTQVRGGARWLLRRN
jgi:hypothetical protein